MYKAKVVCTFATAMLMTAPVQAGESDAVRRVRSNAGGYVLDVKALEHGFVRDRMLSFAINVTRTEGGSSSFGLQFDAGMPAHGHGLVVMPRVEAVAENEYLVRGVRFHMPGMWKLYFDVDFGSVSERTSFSVVVK